MSATNHNAAISSNIETADIIVTIYQAYKPGVPGSQGPSGLPRYCGVAGVSNLNCRPEFFGVTRNLSESNKDVCIDKEIGGLGQPPYRKSVKIELPDHVHYGDFEMSGLAMRGLYSDFSATDGMGSFVGVWCRESVVFEDENREKAIDEAIKSGVVVYAPTENGKREEITVNIVSVSDIFADHR